MSFPIFPLGAATGCVPQLLSFLQLQQEALAEYEEKMKAVSAEVQDLVKNCVKACFPLETEMAKEEALNAASEGDETLKTQLQENNLMSESTQPETHMAENDLELEESTDTQDSRL